jgi:hypothetical protein
MPNVTYYVVVPFSRGDDGNLVPGEAKEAPNGELARRRAQAACTVSGNVGSVAFSRTGDPESGDFQDATIIATYGEVDMGALIG